MELKLLTVLALFAVCGIVQARQVAPDCDSICLHQREGSSARNVVRGKKHRASRSKGHLAPASRQHDYDFSTFCASCYGSETTGTFDRAISSRQSQSFPASIVSTAMQIPEEAMNGAFGGSSGSGGSGSSSFLSGFPNPFSIFSSGSGSSQSGSGSSGGGSGSSGGGIFGFPAEMMNSITGGSGSSSLPFGVPNPLSVFSQGQSSSGGSGSSDSGSGSSGGGSGSSGGGIFGVPAQMLNSVFGQSGSSSLPFGVPNPMSIFSQGQSSGSGSGSSDSGSGSSGSESGSSGSGSGASGFFDIPEEFADAVFGTGQSGSQGSLTAENLVSYCQQACNFAVPSSKARRPEASGRKGASHGHKERHASRSALPQHTAVQHTRQAGSSSSGICPTICENLDSFVPGFGSSSESSSSGSSAGSTGESGTSSQTSSDSQGGSTTGSEESSTSS